MLDIVGLRRAVLSASAKMNTTDLSNEEIAEQMVAFDDHIAGFAPRQDYYALEREIVKILEEPR